MAEPATAAIDRRDAERRKQDDLLECPQQKIVALCHLLNIVNKIGA
mgnify:CR=1 FL=1